MSASKTLFTSKYFLMQLIVNFISIHVGGNMRALANSLASLVLGISWTRFVSFIVVNVSVVFRVCTIF